jgi:hypothetical protein
MGVDADFFIQPDHPTYLHFGKMGQKEKPRGKAAGQVLIGFRIDSEHRGKDERVAITINFGYRKLIQRVIGKDILSHLHQVIEQNWTAGNAKDHISVTTGLFDIFFHFIRDHRSRSCFETCFQDSLGEKFPKAGSAIRAGWPEAISINGFASIPSKGNSVY